MYQPVIKDILCTQWHEFEDKLVAYLLIYLEDETTERAEDRDNSFGFRQSVAVPLDASSGDKKSALEKGASKLLEKFNVSKSALKHQDFVGDLEKLKPVPFPGAVSYAEAITNV